MQVRIIFRGLTLFTFEGRSTEKVKKDTDMGVLTAWLVSDPRMAGMDLHEHKPRFGTLARESHAGSGRAQPKRDFPKEMRLTLMGHGGPASGVRVAESFLDYVPHLDSLHRQKRSAGEVVSELERQFALPQGFVTRKIVIPSGTIRTREFIAWDWHGNTPTKVAFMDTEFQGYASNEVVVEIGDDSDPKGEDAKRYLEMKYGETKKKFWSYTKGTQHDDDIEPNRVELLFNNNTARRGTSVFWGLHMMSLFDAAGYTRRPYDGDQYAAFERAAVDYDEAEWILDRDMMGIGTTASGQPFPFLMVDPQVDKLTAIRNVNKSYIIPGPPPHPAGQPKPGNDPVNVIICPQGRT
jgi:hypothetical protein